MQLPTIHYYCKPSKNAVAFTLGDTTVWFSYRTVVAYQTRTGSAIVVRRNDWGPTTGKHLNAIDGGEKANRIPGVLFEKRLREIPDEVWNFA